MSNNAAAGPSHSTNPSLNAPAPSPTVVSSCWSVNRTAVIPSSHITTLHVRLSQITRGGCAENLLMNALNALPAACIEPATHSIPNNDFRVALEVCGDVDISSYTRGFNVLSYEMQELQQAIKRWVGSNRVGINKPDIVVWLQSDVFDCLNGQDVVERSNCLLGLVGEIKVLRKEGGKFLRDGSESGATTATGGTATRMNAIWRKGMAKSIIYLISSFETFGTWLGLTFISSLFSRLIFLNRDGNGDKIAIECTNDFLVTYNPGRILSAKEYLTHVGNVEHLAHNLSRPDPSSSSIDHDALTVLLGTYMDAAEILTHVDLSDPLLKIRRPPDQPTMLNIIDKAITPVLSGDSAKFDVVQMMRSGCRYVSPPPKDSQKWTKSRKLDDTESTFDISKLRSSLKTGERGSHQYPQLPRPGLAKRTQSQGVKSDGKGKK